MREPHPKATLAASILGSSLAFIDGSVVNVALPALEKDLHAGGADLSWAINAYALPLGALILLGGSLGDHFGRRRLFLLGIGLFAAASILCAAAPDFTWLLAGRASQGLGAALLMPNSLALLGGAFAGEERGRAIGTWAAVGAIAGAVGPILGGWLVDASSWRTIFLINVPVAAGAAYFALRYVDEQKESAAGLRLDVAGSALITLALGCITWSLTESAKNGHSAVAVGISTALGLLMFSAFLWWERRLRERAIMPFAMFASRDFVGLTLLTFFLYGALGGLIVLLPYLMIQVLHWSATAAGAALLPVPLLIGSGSRFMGRVAAKIGGRLPLSLGSLLVGVGLWWYGSVDAGAGYWHDIFPPTLVVAIGMGMCVAPLTTAVMASVDTDHVGVASGFNSAMARIAGLLATALLGFVFTQHADVQLFFPAFHRATHVGAGCAVFAALCALLLMRKQNTRPVA
jgi:EmrB/QacA subfamily drug resistance transporter